VRFAVVGADAEVQASVLPAFVRARRARLATLVAAGGDLRERALSGRLVLARTWALEEYDECLASGSVDAVYVGVPTSLRRDYAVRAARHGVHVLCRTPMAATVRDCAAMIEAARSAGVELMPADRARFDPASVGAEETLGSGLLGELRAVTSVVVRGGDRDVADASVAREALLEACAERVGATRRLFAADPIGVTAMPAGLDACTAWPADGTTAALLRFPRGRTAMLLGAEAATGSTQMRLLGTRGDLLVEGGRSFAGERSHRLAVGDRVREKRFPPVDAFARALDHFAECILERRRPRVACEEALADVRVLSAIARSAATQRLERLASEPHETSPIRPFRFPPRVVAGGVLASAVVPLVMALGSPSR
jgi:glucose-fructose oxidoreductase